MDIRKPQKSGQAALEYMLILTVVAVVVFLAIKPAGSPTVLNRAQTVSEGYYNIVTEVIMGKNPQPVDGGWCPPKPNGERECACPQPAFGGDPCTSPDPSIIYCGDGICNGSETGEPGSPFTCFVDCDYLPDCGLCATQIPSSGCGLVCGGATCTIGQVCMTSDCPPACPGFTQTCVTDAAQCSGACFCNPGAWTEVSGCGIPSGTCTPTWLEKCFTNATCNAACTPAQTIKAISDPTCGSCPATPYAITCGTGTVTLPATNRGQWGTVNCPFGCTTQPMRAYCLDDGSGFGLPENICIPAVCLATTYNTGVCGLVNLPITSPGDSTPPVPCRVGCTGTITGTCPSGTATFVVGGTCVPDNCVATPYTTSFCGGVILPPTNHGSTANVPCPGGCTGAGITAACSFGVFGPFTDNCLANCPATPAAAGACGVATLPAGTPSGSVGSVACPGTCTGTVSALCTNGTYGPPSNTCLLDCPALPVGAGSCGATSLPSTTSGSVSSIACPSGCSGTLSATCTNGAFGPVTNDCGCPTSVVGSSCGAATLPPAVNGSPSSTACPGACTGTVSATCASGTFGPVTDTCLTNCSPTAVPTPCGPATLPGVTSGNPSSAPCPVGCSGGPLTATCTNGSFGPVSGACLADCAAASVPTPCGNVILPATTSGSISSSPCLGGCTGGPLQATCTNGSFGPVSGVCTPSNCPPLGLNPPGCGLVSLPGVPDGVTSSVPCPGGCLGSLQATCSGGTFGPVTGVCAPPAPCLDAFLPVPGCGNIFMPFTISGNISTNGCTGGCTGNGNSLCTNGVWGPVVGCVPPATPCGAPTCYNCAGSVCVIDNVTGPFSDPACLGTCGGGGY